MTFIAPGNGLYIHFHVERQTFPSPTQTTSQKCQKRVERGLNPPTTKGSTLVVGDGE